MTYKSAFVYASIAGIAIAVIMQDQIMCAVAAFIFVLSAAMQQML